jgi:hypothetical protein
MTRETVVIAERSDEAISAAASLCHQVFCSDH